MTISVNLGQILGIVTNQTISGTDIKDLQWNTDLMCYVVPRTHILLPVRAKRPETIIFINITSIPSLSCPFPGRPDVLTKCSGPTLKNSNSIFLSHLEFILVEVFLNIFMILNGFRAVDSSCEKLGSLPISRKRLVRPYELVRYSTKSRTVTDGSLATLGRMLPNHETKIIHSQLCLACIKSLSKTFVGTYLRSTQM